MRRGAETAVKRCMAISPGESVLVITDALRRGIGRAIFEVVSEVTEAVYVEVEADERHGAEPPEPVAAAMAASDVVFVPTTRSLTHTKARKRACGAGARVATMPGITEEMMGGAMLADYGEIAIAVAELAEKLGDARRIRLSSKEGTELLLDVEGCAWAVDTGLCHEPGCYTNLPAGEVYVAPRSGSGSLVVDGSMSGMGVLEEPVEIEFEEGYATHVSSEVLRTRLDEAGECGRNLAEFGIGMNPGAALIGNVLQDEKVMGTVHVALGDNTGFGGDVDCPLHLDGVLTGPEVEVDGSPLPLR